MTYIDKRRIGQNIKSAAKKHGYSLVKLAETAELDSMRLYDYTKGVSAPNSITLYKIAQVLGVTMDSLFEGVEVDNDEG